MELINRAIEMVRRQGHVHRELARRARDAVKHPVIIVPSVIGVRLVDESGRAVWGSTRHLFRGPGPADVAELRPAGLLDSFRLVPGIYRHDVFGALVRYIEHIYGARLGEGLFVLDYDWRAPLARCARDLARLVARVRGTSDEHVDLIGISSGGPVIRTFLAGGWTDDPDDALGDPVLGPTVSAVNRVIYLGAGLLGNFAAFDSLLDGLVPVVGGYKHTASALQSGCTSLFDLLPHHRIFVDSTGAPLDYDHLDPVTWRDLKLVGHDRPGLGDDLARARRNHALVAAAEANHPQSIVIADRHRRATARAVVDRGRVICPCDGRKGDLERYPFAFEPGDGVVPAATMAAAPNQPADGPWWIETSAHHRIATDAHVSPLVVEALLSPLKPVPRERYLWPRNPQTRGIAPPESEAS